MNDISKHILEQIKEGGIKPRPRWQFVLARVLLIAALIASIVTGGLVMSLVFLKLGNLDWEYVSMFGERGLPPVFDVLPLIWISLLILVVLLAVFVFEKTDGGYKYSPGWIVLGAMALSLLLAGVIYLSSGAERFEEVMRNGLPFYEEMESRREARFHLPGMGILPGRVLAIQSRTEISLEDLQDQEWQVILVPVAAEHFNMMQLKPGQMIVAVGEKTTDDEFEAREIRLKRGMVIRMKANFVQKRAPAGQPGQMMLPPPLPPETVTIDLSNQAADRAL
jgi:hypothetical protein